MYFFENFRAGLHNSESTKGQIIKINCRRLQKSISFQCRNFILL